jgi:hypothetical protein
LVASSACTIKPWAEEGTDETKIVRITPYSQLKGSHSAEIRKVYSLDQNAMQPFRLFKIFFATENDFKIAKTDIT